jgi:hypothetical protein
MGVGISSSSQMEGLNKSFVNTPGGGWFMAQSELGEGVGCLIVSLEDMMELKTIELLFQHPDLLLVCRHAGVMVVRLSHDLVDDELIVATDVKSFNPELSGDA